MRLKVKRLDPDVPLPSYAHKGDAGLDLCAAEDVTLEPGERAAVGTGIAVAIQRHYAGFIHARSGRALRDGLALPNAPGVVDSSYRGEVKVLVVNLDPREPIHIRRGEKIAQMVIQEVAVAELHVVDDLGETDRGEGGFGSTGR